jgi:hypothetical protein
MATENKGELAPLDLTIEEFLEDLSSDSAMLSVVKYILLTVSLSLAGYRETNPEKKAIFVRKHINLIKDSDYLKKVPMENGTRKQFAQLSTKEINKFWAIIKTSIINGFSNCTPQQLLKFFYYTKLHESRKLHGMVILPFLMGAKSRG